MININIINKKYEEQNEEQKNKDLNNREIFLQKKYTFDNKFYFNLNIIRNNPISEKKNNTESKRKI